MTSARDAIFARSVRNVALAAGAAYEQIDTGDDRVVFSVTFDVRGAGPRATARLGMRSEPGGGIGIDVGADYAYDDERAAAECANIVAGVSEWIAFERMRFDDFAELREHIGRHRPLDDESPDYQAWIRYEQDGGEAYVSVYAIDSELEEWIVFRAHLCDEAAWSPERALETSVELPYAMIGLQEGEYVLFYCIPLEALSLGRALDIADTMGGTALRLAADIAQEADEDDSDDDDDDDDDD
jgi:hypothetical protein